MQPFAIDVLERLAWSTPFLVLVGITLRICFANWEKNPSLAKLIATAFVLIGGQSILSILNKAWFSTTAGGQSTSSMITAGTVYAVLSGLAGVINLVGWGLIALAIHRFFKCHPAAPGI